MLAPRWRMSDTPIIGTPVTQPFGLAPTRRFAGLGANWSTNASGGTTTEI